MSQTGGGWVSDGFEENPSVDVSCSEAYLRRITGEEDLGDVHDLVLTVDTNVTQVDHLGTLMPRLSELRLVRGSTLASFRDLGSSLVNLRVLWLSACGIRHLDGVGALSGLEELYLAFNDVEDLTSIALHDRLEVLDLESNSVRDAEQAFQLGTCSRLWSLTLTANPLCSERFYRRMVVEAVPQLASLDEADITDDDRRPPSAANEADDHEGLAHSQQPLSMKLVPPHRHGSPLPNPSSQPSPDGAKQSSCPEQFPLGSTGAGNRNLRELELSEAYHVHHGLSREGAKPTVAGNGVGPTGGDEQAAVEPTTSESLSPRNRTGTAQPAGAFDGVSGRDPPEDTTAATARLVYISERSQGWSGGPENVQQAGGVDGNEEALSGGDARTDRGGGGEARLEVDCLPQVSSRNDTATDVMDEEEMVVKAIKNFRLLPHESNTHTPRWRGAAEKATPFRGPRTTADRHNATWAGEENEACRGRDKGAESAALRSQEGVQRGKNISPRPSARQACGLAEAGEGHSARGRRSSGRKYFCEGSDWILQVLSLEDMEPASMPRGGCASGEGTIAAASALTHGSQMSIAGNPAFGLRRRRVLDRTANPRSKANASASSMGPCKAETHHQAPSAARAQVGTQRVAQRRAQRDPSRPRHSSTLKPASTRPKSTGEVEGRCVHGSGTSPNGGLEMPPATDGRATGGSLGLHAEFASAEVGSVTSWPLTFSSHNARIRHGGAPGHRYTAPAASSLCCRALLSPPTRSPQSLCGVRRRPPVAERGAGEAGTESFIEKVEASRAGVCFSPISGAVVTVSGADVANARSRSRNGRSGAREVRKPVGVLNSKSAASLIGPDRTEVGVVGEEGGRRKRPASGVCGTRGTTAVSSRADMGDPGGVGDGSADGDRRTCLVDGEGVLNDENGRSSRSRRGGRTAHMSLKQSEVPEWSPTAMFESDTDIEREVGENRSACGGRRKGLGFRVCEAKELAVYGGGGGGRDDGAAFHGSVDGAAVGGGDGGGTAQPFVPNKVTIEAGRAGVGPGVSESDEKLVALLRERPKNVPQMRTRESFRNYVRGMDRERLGRLLREAYADRGLPECDAKVKKRLVLLERSLGASYR